LEQPKCRSGTPPRPEPKSWRTRTRRNSSPRQLSVPCLCIYGCLSGTLKNMLIVEVMQTQIIIKHKNCQKIRKCTIIFLIDTIPNPQFQHHEHIFDPFQLFASSNVFVLKAWVKLFFKAHSYIV
jgi:hypothetical protein